MTRIGETKVTQNYSISIPKKVRDELGDVKIGQFIVFEKIGNNIIIKKADLVTK